MPNKYVAFEVSQLDTFSDVSEEQPLNINPADSIEEVIQPERFREVSE